MATCPPHIAGMDECVDTIQVGTTGNRNNDNLQRHRHDLTEGVCNYPLRPLSSIATHLALRLAGRGGEGLRSRPSLDEGRLNPERDASHHSFDTQMLTDLSEPNYLISPIWMQVELR